MDKFQLVSDYAPSKAQFEASVALEKGFKEKHFQRQILQGVTGSGKTFTMAQVIERMQKPALILSHNKTLAAQLYREFKIFFPHNAVEYFISYYDYYQPEAYLPHRDIFIEKDASINEDIDRLRLATTSSLAFRKDVIIVATVSSIYGLTDPTTFRAMGVSIEVGENVKAYDLALKLVAVQYQRNDDVVKRGTFRFLGDSMEIYPAYRFQEIIKITWEWEEISSIKILNALTKEVLNEVQDVIIFPAKHFVAGEDQQRQAIKTIRAELELRHEELLKNNKLVEAQRLKARTEQDLEMIEQLGYCSGIENYSRHFDNRLPGTKPFVLLDHFPSDYMLFIDESHVTLGQVRAMYNGDRQRKENLVEFGFRLPCAFDNRPLKYEEFEEYIQKVVYVSATPGKEEKEKSQAEIEQIIRPTGLLDPEIFVRSSLGQIDDVYNEIQKRVAVKERVLITTLTKKMAEDLTQYLLELNVKANYLHSELDTFERVKVLQELRQGKIDVVVGINLLREGLDLPEVSLVVILDADKIGFLRSTTSLIQTIGRAARNSGGQVIMYADTISLAMKEAIEQTVRRRKIQSDYNTAHGITPTTIHKELYDILDRQKEEEFENQEEIMKEISGKYRMVVAQERKKFFKEIERKMDKYAQDMEFEKAIYLRDEIKRLKEQWGD